MLPQDKRDVKRMKIDRIRELDAMIGELREVEQSIQGRIGALQAQRANLALPQGGVTKADAAREGVKL